jgi:hypothetical protein
MTTATVGLGYFFVVASFFIKDNQGRVAAMTGFVTGQFVMFTSMGRSIKDWFNLIASLCYF